MPANVSTTGTISINQIQPKFKDCLLNSKTKAQLRSWIKLIGGIVRNIENGHSLEDFLDYYLKRNTKECNTAPNFLQEEALQIGNTEDQNVTPTRTSSSPSVESDNEVVINRTRPPAYDDNDEPFQIPENATEPPRETKNLNTVQLIHVTVIFPQKPCTWTRSCSTCSRRLLKVTTLTLSLTSPATTPATLSQSSHYGNTQHLKTAPDVLPQWKRWRICSSRVMDPSGSWILYEQYEKCMTQD